MVSILIVAHAPLASALQAIAGHTYAECSGDVVAVDVRPGSGLSGAEAQIRAALAAMSAAEVLILSDVFGATPCTAALNVADGARARVVAGVNVPMLWRSLCYAHLPLADLVERAADGGRQGIMPITSPRRQDQPQRPPIHDPDQDPDQ
jgi:PTS system ascorbate-specific IIA component